MEGGQHEKEGEPKNSYSHWVCNTFNIPQILPWGFVDLSNVIVPSFPMLASSLVALPTTCSH
jgi:hypothetical protein